MGGGGEMFSNSWQGIRVCMKGFSNRVLGSFRVLFGLWVFLFAAFVLKNMSLFFRAGERDVWEQWEAGNGF